MQRTVQEIFEDQALVNIEDRIAPLAEVFRLQRTDELWEAEERYLPKNATKAGPVVFDLNSVGDVVEGSALS